MRLLVRTVTALALSVGIAAPSTALAATAPFVSVTPTSGPAGSQFTINWSGFTSCRVITFTWAGTPLASGKPGTTGSVVATAPADAKPGTYAINATCAKETGLTRFTVTVTPTTTTTPPPTTGTTPPVVTTTPPAVTTTTPPVVTTTTSATTTPSATTPTTSTAESVTDEPKTDGGLTLNHTSIQPGDPLSASGTGCEPGHDVTLTSDGQLVGTAKADSGGAFTAPVEFTTIEAGRHTITASCGVQLTGVVDQAVTSSSGDYSSTLIVLVFFVLGGIVFVRFAY
ncbi:serine/arginine repetitive matrix protein 1 [Kutzneria sp. 744]|nr:serine/arginine repetitive matrix protein 1 [Kutzneria sp. 744]